jgi:hypothetical protein
LTRTVHIGTLWCAAQWIAASQLIG